jgi:hypothetical protein
MAVANVPQERPPHGHYSCGHPITDTGVPVSAETVATLSLIVCQDCFHLDRDRKLAWMQRRKDTMQKQNANNGSTPARPTPRPAAAARTNPAQAREPDAVATAPRPARPDPFDEEAPLPAEVLDEQPLPAPRPMARITDLLPEPTHYNASDVAGNDFVLKSFTFRQGEHGVYAILNATVQWEDAPEEEAAIAAGGTVVVDKLRRLAGELKLGKIDLPCVCRLEMTETASGRPYWDIL